MRAETHRCATALFTAVLKVAQVVAQEAEREATETCLIVSFIQVQPLIETLWLVV